jgi:hypothetical protein
MVLFLRAHLQLLDCDDLGETELMGLSRMERRLRDNGESDLLVECFVKDGRDSRIECLLKSRTCLSKARVDSARGKSTNLRVPMDSEACVARVRLVLAASAGRSGNVASGVGCFFWIWTASQDFLQEGR